MFDRSYPNGQTCNIITKSHKNLVVPGIFFYHTFTLLCAQDRKTHYLFKF